MARCRMLRAGFVVGAIPRLTPGRVWVHKSPVSGVLTGLATQRPLFGVDLGIQENGAPLVGLWCIHLIQTRV